MSFVKFLALFLVGFEQEEIAELPWVVWGFSATGRECRSGVSKGEHPPWTRDDAKSFLVGKPGDQESCEVQLCCGKRLCRGKGQLENEAG